MRGTHARCVGRRCDDHEGVGIHVGDKTYLCGEMQVGTDAMRVRGNASMWVGQGGIHVRMCRWAWM